MTSTMMFRCVCASAQHCLKSAGPFIGGPDQSPAIYPRRSCTIQSLGLAHSLVLTLCLLLGMARPGEAGQIRIHWVDRGITFLGEAPTAATAEPPIFVPNANRIVIRMPIAMKDGDQRDLTEAEMLLFEEAMREDMMKQIKDLHAKGVDEFEIRTIQAINAGGYLHLSQEQQKRVLRFTNSFLTALADTKSALEETDEVSCDAAVGSNGAMTAAVLIPRLNQQQRNPFDSVAIFDGRATRSQVERLLASVGGRLTIVNTSVDAPDGPLAEGDCYIANHDCAKGLKEDHPEISVFWTDPAEMVWTHLRLSPLSWGYLLTPLIPWVRDHLAMMENGDRLAWVKEYNGKGYEAKERVTTTAFLERIRVKLQAKQTEKSSNEVAGVKRPSPLENRRDDLGGVDMAPVPKQEAKELHDLKNRILKKAQSEKR